MRNVIHAVISYWVHVLRLALPNFRVRILVVLLSTHVDPWQLRVEMLHYSPEEDIIAVLDVQHDFAHVDQLFQLQVVQFQKVPRNKGCSRLGNAEIECSCVALVQKLDSFVRIESVSSDFVRCHSSKLLFVDLVESV